MCRSHAATKTATPSKRPPLPGATQNTRECFASHQRVDERRSRTCFSSRRLGGQEHRPRGSQEGQGARRPRARARGASRAVRLPRPANIGSWRPAARPLEATCSRFRTCPSLPGGLTDPWPQRRAGRCDRSAHAAQGHLQDTGGLPECGPNNWFRRPCVVGADVARKWASGTTQQRTSGTLKDGTAAAGAARERERDR